MKKLIFLIAFSIIGCKGSNSETTTFADTSPTPPIGVAACAPQYEEVNINNGPTETLYFGLGYFIAINNHDVWLKHQTEPYYYKVDDNTLELGGANDGLIYTDAQCSDLIGEVFNYPLHLSGDIYLFQFEDQLYEYHIGEGLDFYGTIDGTYYFKTEYGPCTPCEGPVTNVRQAIQSAFTF